MKARHVVSSILAVAGICAPSWYVARAEPQIGAPQVEIQRMEEKEPKLETLILDLPAEGRVRVAYACLARGDRHQRGGLVDGAESAHRAGAFGVLELQEILDDFEVPALLLRRGGGAGGD